MTAEERHDKAEAVALRSGLVGFHGWGMLIDDIAKAIAEAEAAARAEERERCATIAENPYGDEVQALGPDEPMAVGAKIAAAIRAEPDTVTGRG